MLPSYRIVHHLSFLSFFILFLASHAERRWSSLLNTCVRSAPTSCPLVAILAPAVMIANR
ncbi:hypothetical protein B0T09DRAFT_350001 [Sordaria sp. MPI-SDFR-AT-0083]|nr:hypothetical protein B0T09DRAFT_350001 [Sordaria sp. MPI-SDFR-AT-0083]